MHELVDFPAPPGLRSLSPFGYKAEALLAMSGIDYARIPPEPELLPHDKVPVLREAGKLTPDSSLIQRRLEAVGLLKCDRSLTTQERAIAEAFRRMTEDHLRWVLVYMRWIDPACEALMGGLAFGHLEEPARGKAFLGVREQVRSVLHAQGARPSHAGRHLPLRMRRSRRPRGLARRQALLHVRSPDKCRCHGLGPALRPAQPRRGHTSRAAREGQSRPRGLCRALRGRGVRGRRACPAPS